MAEARARVRAGNEEQEDLETVQIIWPANTRQRFQRLLFSLSRFACLESFLIHLNVPFFFFFFYKFNKNLRTLK